MNWKHMHRAISRLFLFVCVQAAMLLPATGLPTQTASAVVVDPPATAVASPASLAEPPFWPIGLVPPNLEPPKPDRNGAIKAPVLVWLPPDATHVRALFIIPNNSDSKHVGEHAAVRAVAARHEMAILYLRHGDVPQVQGILDAVAQHTGIREVRHAPWIPFGKSSRGRFPILMAWQYPERTVACVSYHAETPPWPPVGAALTSPETILHLNINGETEWGGTWFVHVRPSLLNYRAHGAWLPHLAVAKGVDHGDYPDANGSPGWGKPFPDRVTCIRVWDYIAVYMDKALSLRVPRDRYADAGPVPLLPIDESAGYLIDPFAVEDLFRQPHYPLVEADGLYAVGKEGERSTSGYVAIPPAAAAPVAEGVPVVPPPIDRGPAAWLVTEPLRFAMRSDPMTELGALASLRPKPGDTVAIDDRTATFNPIAARAVSTTGGISLQGVKAWGEAVTILGYTVIDVPAPMRLKLHAPFSVAGRLQVVLNGVPVAHRQVVDLRQGLYPMLVVLRLAGPNWGAIEPSFATVTEAEVEDARAYAAELDARAAEQARLLAEGRVTPLPPVRPAAAVPAAERRRMFWVADREQAAAWFRLHAVHGQSFDR